MCEFVCVCEVGAGSVAGPRQVVTCGCGTAAVRCLPSCFRAVVLACSGRISRTRGDVLRVSSFGALVCGNSVRCDCIWHQGPHVHVSYDSSACTL